MARVGQDLFTKSLPKNVTEKFRRMMEFRPDDPARGWQVPSAKLAEEIEKQADFLKPVEYDELSRKDIPDSRFDTNRFKRDTKHLPSKNIKYVAPSLRKGPLFEYHKAKKALKTDDKPSDGAHIPAVFKYDPTGLRAAQTASPAALKKELEKLLPDHITKPVWMPFEKELAEEDAKKGLPPAAGYYTRFEHEPRDLKVASW